MDKVIHFEIRVDDLERAKQFYSLFDWRMIDVPGVMPFTSVITTPTDEKFNPTEPGAINGVLFKRKKSDPPGPTLTIQVESIDEYARKIEVMGGLVVMEKTEIPAMGCYAYFSDPDGNVFGLWEELKKSS